MISLEKWAELQTDWETIGAVYQIPRRSYDRLKHFCEVCLPYLKGKKVVEIGCNAGIFGYEIAQVAESYMGVEPATLVRDPSKKGPPKTDYFKQAEITAKHIAQDFQKTAIFLNKTITDYTKEHEFAGNAFVACFALYHFMDHELKALDEHVFPKCDTVIIQNRCQDRPTPHNSFKFWKTKNVVKYFTNRGYKCQVFGSISKDGRQVFDEVVCLK